MTTRAAFTQDEWEVLSKTLHEPSVVVMIASPGGGLWEIFAMIQGALEAAEKFSESELAQSLLNEMAPSRQEPRPRLKQTGRAPGDAVFDLVMDEMIAHLRRAVKIVAAKATAQEVDEYRQLVMFLAEKTANAASEGSFLGMGGERVTEDERRVLDEIKLALHRKV
ncbi:MAG TPA: hypothetical protein VI547_16435 [Anaerolineales bacterium]|nr:hypothetical protein [Anaerolineales bacterium]HLF03575.1 hypothetical protein [Anaerolineales bacterium]